MRRLAERAMDGVPVAYFAPTYKMLADVFRTMAWRLGPLGITVSKVERRIDLPDGGSIDYWSMEDDANAARGRRYALVALDECALVPGLLVAWEEAIEPTLTDYRGAALFVSTPRRGGGFQALFEKSGRDWASLRITSLENPHLPKGEVPASEAEALARGKSIQAYRQEYLADFEASESELVFPEFREESMVRPAPVPWRACKWRVVGIDPGGGDPTAIVPLGVSSDERYVHQYGEFYRRGDVDIDALVEYLQQLGEVDMVVVGETNGNIIVNSLRQRGFPAYKAPLARAEGMESMRWLLQSGRFSIEPVCTNSIAEFGSYRWARARDGVTGERYATSTPVDHHADAMDARRYAWLAIVQTMPGTGVEVETQWQ